MPCATSRRIGTLSSEGSGMLLAGFGGHPPGIAAGQRKADCVNGRLVATV